MEEEMYIFNDYTSINLLEDFFPFLFCVKTLK